MPAILDAAIGTVFVFLLFSLVVSAFNELILSKFDQRAKFLHMGLQELFGEANCTTIAWRKGWWKSITGGLCTKITIADGEWTHSLYNHGLINSFSRNDKPEGSSPSYIPAGAFVTALLDIVAHGGADPKAKAAAQPAQPAGQALPSARTQDSSRRVRKRDVAQLGSTKRQSATPNVQPLFNP